MANLDNYSNIYADLAQGSYTGRPKKYSFPYDILTQDNQNKLDSDESIKFTFPGAKNAQGDSTETLYLQPDPSVETITEKKFLGKDKEYQKGLLTDEKAGYNSYYVTDTPTLNTGTKHTYFTTRGSDGASTDVKKGWAGNNLNDWVNNNAAFAVGHGYIPIEWERV